MGAVLKGVTLPKRHRAPLERIEIAPPTRVVLPLIQHLGEPATPAVGVGDQVAAGQLVASAATDYAAPIYSPLTGTVTAVTTTYSSRGQDTEAVVIEGKPEEPKKTGKPPDPGSLSPAQLTDALRGAGLLSPGLAPVPLIRDFLPPEQPAARLPLTGTGVVKAIDTLLITALDPEPSLGVNRYVAGLDSAALAAGITALKTITGAQQVVIATDSSFPSPPPLAALAAHDEQETTAIVRINGRHYPSGLPVPLIKAAVGREVPLPFGQPRDVGVALCTVAAARSLGDTLTTGSPPSTTYLTVGGAALKQQGIVEIPTGTTIADLVEALGGFARQPAKLIVGGLMTGFAHYDLSVPLARDAGGLFALTDTETTPVGAYRQCINCGRCVAVCPVNLVPGMLSMYCANDRFEEAAAKGLLACIECGCCDYVCPARRPLVHLFRHAKHQLMEESA